MKTVMHRRMLFISRSLLWSLLFYLISLAILDWNSLVAGIKNEKSEKAYVVKEEKAYPIPRVSTKTIAPEIRHSGVVLQIIKWLAI